MIDALVLAFAIGVSVPSQDVIDEHGRTRSISEFRGSPVILAPMFTRCPLACPLIARGIKSGVAKSDAAANTYRVVLVSFDTRDTPADLRRFRERNGIPLAWTIVKASDPHALLDPLGYRFADTNGLFTHPNAIVALTPELKTAKWLIGTQYDIDEALAVAGGRRDWLARYGPWLMALLLFLALLAATYLVSLITSAATAETRN